MIICTWIGKNYKESLDIMFPTWKAEKILVYTDTDEFGIKLFPSESTDFNENCRRKIFAIKRTLIDNPNKDVLYIDSDVMMIKSPEEVFDNDFDVCATRMVHRTDKAGEKDINAGVSFWKSNDKTIKFCDEWLKLEKQFRDNQKYPEQHAFSNLCYMGYDQLIDVKVINVSERIYNFEHDSLTTFTQWLPIYKPKLVHFKTKRWQNKQVVALVKSMI